MDCERATMAVLERALANVDRSEYCFEAGAGTGNFYAEMFRRLGHWPLVIEPMPTPALEDLIGKGGIDLAEVALGAFNGQAPLYTGHDADYGSLRPDWYGRTSGETMVEVMTLPTIVARLAEGARVACLKLDIEGGEPDVIATLPDLPTDLLPRIIAFEYGGAPNRAAGTGAWSAEYRARTIGALTTLRDLGYGQVMVLDAALEYVAVADLRTLPIDAAALDETFFDTRCVYGMIVALRGAALDVEAIAAAAGMDALRTSRCTWEATDADPRPDVTLVSGTYNRLPILQDMIASARREVLSTLKMEVLLVDGGSTDGTLEWAATQPDVRVIRQTKLHGAILAFNDGFYAAHGRYVVIANDDVVFQPGSIAAAFAILEDTPDIGAVAFEEKRQDHDWRVSTYHAARNPDEFLIMPQVCMVPVELGDAAQWWKLSGALTYGGDFALGVRLAEMGYRVVKVPQARIFDKQYLDDLRRINLRAGEKATSWHPDGDTFMMWRPNGVYVKDTPQFPFSPQSPALRVMHLPIRAAIPADPQAYRNQCTQMRGMNEALARIGRLVVYDYLSEAGRRGQNGMHQHLIDTMAAFGPHLVVFQLHGPMGGIDAGIVNALRAIAPGALFVNWVGDVYPELMLAPDALALARTMDLTGVVNADAIPVYEAQGLKVAYWQIGFEPDMLTAEPDAETPRHDVLFLGSGNNAHREALGATLRALEGVNVGLYGVWEPQYAANGVCYQDFQRQGQLYRAAKIAVADQEWPERDGFCSNRTFNLLSAGGALCLHRRFKGMEARLGLVDGVHFIGWDSLDELPGLVATWLAPEKDKARRKIAKAAQAHVLANHSFDARIRELIFDLLPGIGGN